MAPAFSATSVAALIFKVSATSLAVQESQQSLLKSWSGVLNTNSGHDTPVTRVVNLLKEMSKTVQAEMDEDDGLYRKLKCWCNDNNWEKGNAIEKSQAKIAELESTIEALTGSTAELRESIKELEAELAADKKALAEATALREKQLDEFHNLEKDEIQNIENLKAALEVLEKHRDAPGSTVAGGAVFKSESEAFDSDNMDSKLFRKNSFLQVGKKDLPSRDMRSFDNFMRHSGLDETIPVSNSDVDTPAAKPKFLQQQDKSGEKETTWSSEDLSMVQSALKSANAFLQSRHGQGYYPAYNFQSNEIVGVLSQLKEELEGDLAEAQKTENQRAAAFAELRAAKKQEIDTGYKMSEEKEDQLAEQDNALAEAKEDLGQEEATLSADQKFVANLKETCAEADKNFDARKAARQQEQTAISETIEILTKDEARDAMTGTFNFLQLSSNRAQQSSHRRQAAAQALRLAARKAQDPQLSVLATAVELDAFTRVKKAIDDMIAMLNQQQEDEVKKTDWCKSELQSNEMATARMETQQADIEAQIAKLESTIQELEAGIADAKSQIASTQLNLQKATMTRKQENLDYQKVVSDQTVTIEVLEKALDKLATYYDLMQTSGKSWIQRQTPPVPQMEYSKNAGATGVMEMIEKLVYDSRELMSNSKKAEGESQAAYETLIADSNAQIKSLQQEVVSKTQAKVDAEKDHRDAKADLAETMRELEGLAKYSAELHAECDYVLKNFDVRQQARREEIVALQQAKQILNGASLS